MSSMKLIRISGIEPESIVDGEGIRYVIFTQGCPHHCPGCHNPQTHPFGGGKLVSIEDILDDISKRKNWIDGITLSGGEPFCHIYQCALIAEKAHEMGLSVWCYTGYLFEDLYRQGIELLKHRLLHTLFYLCELADFEIEGRIILVDKRNGRVWR